MTPSRHAQRRAANCFSFFYPRINRLYRVACGAFPAIRASAISRAVIGASARRNTSTVLLNSVPRLNQGLLLLPRFALMPRTSKPGWSICRTASTCIMAVLILTPAFRFSAKRHNTGKSRKSLGYRKARSRFTCIGSIKGQAHRIAPSWRLNPLRGNKSGQRARQSHAKTVIN